jgi:hypothetical protein
MMWSHVSRALVVACVSLGVILAIGNQALSESGTMPNAKTTPDELLVKFSEQVSASKIEDLNKSLGVEVVNRASGGRLLLVRPSANSFEETKAAYQATPGVEYVEPNYVVHTQPDTESRPPP